MLQPTEKHSDSEENPEKTFEEIQSAHKILSTEIQELEQQLKTKRAEIINIASKSNLAHPLLNKADEVWFNIFSYLPSKDRVSAQRTCMRFFQLGKDPRLPKFPLDYTATPKHVDISNIVSSSLKDIDLFNLPLTNQFLLAEFIDEAFEDESEQFSYMIHVVNSHTGLEEARFKIELPFQYISEITASEKNQLIFIGKSSNGILFLAYDLQSRNKEIIYQQAGELVDIKRLSSGQFAVLHNKSPQQLRLLILKNKFKQQTFIDIPLELDYSPNLYEIKTGKYKNHILIYDKRNFIIIDLEGVIQKTLSLNENELPKFTSIYSGEIQEPKANELIFNCSSALLHLNLITGIRTFHDLRSFLNEWSMRKFLDRENILLVNHLNHSNQLIFGNCRTLTPKVITTFADKEFPYDTLTLNNGHLVVKIKHAESGKFRYAHYRFPEQQFIAQPSQRCNLGRTDPTAEVTTRSRPRN